MKRKFKRNEFVKKLFENYAFRIIFNDPKVYDIKKLYISKKLFKGMDHGSITILFFNHKKISIKYENNQMILI